MMLAAISYAGCSGGNGGGNAPAAARPFPQAAGDTFPQISIALFASGFSRPVHVTHAGDGSGRVFVVEKAGRIRIVRNGIVQQTPFLDISSRVLSAGGEQGLLSAAFPPGYSGKGYFYVNYSDIAGNGDTVVARYRITADPDIADPASEQVVLTVDQPFANHNGGQLAFGPDGFLYIGMGDGGSGGDPFNNGQNRSALLGKLLRLDVESNPAAPGYSIPASNPFVGNAAARGEIWALGLRNPWRFSFDRLTGDLYIADVGQNTIEEIDFQASTSTGGENYGWNVMEGSRCFLQPAGCSTSGFVQPVAEYDHSLGDCSVTGGMVYRGQEFASMQGVYFLGDFCTGTIRAVRRSDGAFSRATLLETGLAVSTFGEDEAGNLYVADFQTGNVFRISAQ
ncbi:MAG: PQQ-dependent sugar dehydrogenase [Nitrospirae bacterium]|nr:PQQ-dependent sugar dehydrogenase [Nitrospirota bacterium]